MIRMGMQSFKMNKWLPFWDQDREAGQAKMNYRHIWQVNFIIACLVTFSPLAVLALTFFILEANSLSTLLWILILIVPVILAAVFWGTAHQVNRLYQMDIQRSEILKEIVYTHRLASVGRLASGVAHEINNPLAVIAEKAGLIRDLVNRDQECCDWLRIAQLSENMQKNCQRASSITRRLLGFARHLKLEPEDLDPVKVIEEVVGLFRENTRYRSISVRIEARPENQTITCDRSALEQIVLTFLDNAFEILPDGGSVDIEVVRTKGEQLRLAFHDNGPGIVPDDMNHLFEPFFSARKENHAGLGLSIAHGIVHKLGGEIHVESEAGQGATFTVILPVKPKGDFSRAVEEDIGRFALQATGPKDLECK